MQLLLTSDGLSNSTLQDFFVDLLPKKSSEVTLAFISTAGNVQKDHAYLEKDRVILKRLGIGTVWEVDISKGESDWMPAIKSSDVIWMEGGNTFYLLNEIRKSGLAESLRSLVSDKLYVGVSAGSILVTPSIGIALVEPPDDNFLKMEDFIGLGWVDFEVSPHTPCYVPLKNVSRYASSCPSPLYAFDDGVALYWENDNVKIIGNGFSKKFTPG